MSLDPFIQGFDPETLGLKNTPKNFCAGKVASALDLWKEITSDPWILATIQGYKIEMISEPVQKFIPKPIKFNNPERKSVKAEIERFLQKQIIEPCPTFVDKPTFYSNVFVVPKRDGTLRTILNLKQLNLDVEYHHFKMDTIKDAIALMKKDCYFASIDLKDAYFSIPVHQDSRRLLRFLWEGKDYQFSCLPQGLSSSPRIFTKLLKPVYAYLRKKGYTIVGYIDDSILIAESKEKLQKAIDESLTLLDGLGFTIHPEKSVIYPTQQIEFLGFLLDSTNMTVSLIDRKKEKIKTFCCKMLSQNQVVIRELAQLIGNLVAAEQAVELAPLHYKSLEIERNRALTKARGDYETRITLSNSARSDLQWWVDHIDNVSKSIITKSPSIFLTSDASNLGWGGSLVQGNEKECKSKNKRNSTGGRWSPTESELHINEQELLGGFLTLQSFCFHSSNVHVRILMDNTTAVACINRQGSVRPKLNQLTREMWQWCSQRGIWLSAVHLPGSQNTIADQESRQHNDDIEWAIKDKVFHKITQKFDMPKVDLFASRLNHKLPKYVAWRPDPKAIAIDAFSLNWADYFTYIFPPFSLLGTVLQKLQLEQATALVILPLWPTRPWFSRALEMLIAEPILLPKNVLYLPQNPDKQHHLQMTLAAMKVSGQLSKVKDFQQMLPKFWNIPGESQQMRNIGHISRAGCDFLSNGTVIHFAHL